MYYSTLSTEVTSIRSGLRKRKRAESPQPTEPQISEEWVDEDKLELWEIKFIGEKQEKARIATVTRSVASRQLESTNGGSLNTSTNGSPGGGRVLLAPKPVDGDVKDKMEQQLKLQRAAHQQRKILNTGEVTRSATPGKQLTQLKFYANIHSISSSSQLRALSLAVDV